MKQLPALGKNSTVRLSRQGGVAAIPALSRPREIEFASCDEREREQVCSVLEGCVPFAAENAGQGDRRYFQIELRYRDDQQAGEWVLQIPEEHAPGDLVRLWKNGTLR
jgi:hypothetical protein